jgi:hypothetical protein
MDNREAGRALSTESVNAQPVPEAVSQLEPTDFL